MKTKMKNVLFAALICITGSLAAQYKPQDTGSSVQFKIKNIGFNVNGSFTGLDGIIRFDPKEPDDSHFDVSIDANTINTDNNMRDNHLRDESYFDVKKYPRIHFVSTKITPSGKKEEMFMFGKLTIKDQTKDITFPFRATPSQDDYLFRGSFKINRKDFGIGGSSTISNELEVSFNILSKKS